MIDPQKYMERQLRKEWVSYCTNCWPEPAPDFEDWLLQEDVLRDE